MMHRRGADGGLVFCALFEGRPIALEPYHWLCEQATAYKRFETAEIDISRWFPVVDGVDISGLNLPFWVDLAATDSSVLALIENMRMDPGYGPGANSAVEALLEAAQKRRGSGGQVTPLPPEAAAPNKPDVDRIKALAAELDDLGISKRDLRKEMITSRWQKVWGPAPTKESVWPYMKGREAGRPTQH